MDRTESSESAFSLSPWGFSEGTWSADENRETPSAEVGGCHSGRKPIGDIIESASACSQDGIKGFHMSVVRGGTSEFSRERWDGRIEALIRWLLHQWEREHSSAQVCNSFAGRSRDAAEVMGVGVNLGGNMAENGEERGKGLDVHQNGAFVFNGSIAGPIGTDRGHMTS